MESAIDIATATERMDGDVDILHAVMQIFLDESPYMLGAIERAVALGDAKSLEFAAHCLKGSALTLAAGRVYEHTRALEDMGREARLDTADGVYRELAAETGRLRDELAIILGGSDEALRQSG